MSERRERIHAVKPGSIGYFNLMRGIAMLLILLGHSVNLVYTTPYLAQTMQGTSSLLGGASTVFGGGLMAMLFLVSGYGFFKRSPKKCWKIQKRMLLIPYMVTALCVILAKAALALIERRSFVEHGGEYILTYLLGLNWERGGRLFGIPVESVSIFWFVLALFVGWNLFNLICQNGNQMYRFTFTFLCVGIGMLMNQISPIWPYCLSIGFVVTGYLYIGNWMRESKWLDKKPFVWEWCVLIGIAGICFMFGAVNVIEGIWKLGLIDWLGSACIGMLFFRAYAACMDKIPQNRGVLLVEEIGQRTIWVLCIHAFEKVVFPWYWIGLIWKEVFHSQASSVLILEGVVIFVLRCILIFIIYKFCYKGWEILRSKSFI